MRICVMSLGLVLVFVAACGGGGEEGATAFYRLGDDAEHFFDFPFPSDLRRVDGRPDMTRYPNPGRSGIVDNLISVSGDRAGFPVTATSYFRFSEALAPRVTADLIAADASSPFLIIDIDPDSPDRGRLFPAVAHTLFTEQGWTTDHTLAVAPWPGIVLRGNTRYAVVVMRSAGTESGDMLAQAPEIDDLRRGKSPNPEWGEAALALYAPLWGVLADLGVDDEAVAAATVFTTGDAVADLAELSDSLLDSLSVTIDNLAVDPDDGATHTRFCELHGTVSMPQFQVGIPPFNTDGLFELGADGLPIVQRMEETKVVITVPTTPMPQEGFPMLIYFHGSGGIATQAVDRGYFDGQTVALGEGPAFVVAEHGIGSVAAALPLSPDRLPGASDIEYLNFSNLAAFRDTFRQGVIESRLLLRAVLDLQIAPELVEACGLTLPNGQSSFYFDGSSVVASGQSMGGMYTNLITPVEPLITAAVPTGAGGHWNRMILSTEVLPGTLDLVSALLRAEISEIDFTHPSLNLLSLGWEAAEPYAYMGRIADEPLPGHAPVPVYQPVGKDDLFFATPIFDGAAIAYRNQQAGEPVWPELGAGLALTEHPELASYPVSNNAESIDGTAYTGVVVQYEEDGLQDAHFIFAQRDEVKYQYGCFFATLLQTGVAVVPAPADLGTPCPTAPAP